MNQNSQSTQKVAAVILIIIGVFVLFLAQDNNKSNKAATQEMALTTGVVSSVTGDLGVFAGNGNCSAEYTYWVDGVEYTITEPVTGKTKPVIGDSVSVWYRLDWPEIGIVQKKSQSFGVLNVIGIFFLLSGVIVLMVTAQAREELVLLLLGFVMVFMGFGVPYVADLGAVEAIFLVFGILGIVVLIKSFLGLTNRKGTAADQKIDELFDNLNDFGNRHM